MTDKLKTSCVSPEFVASFVNVFEPAQQLNGGEAYSVQMLIDEGADLEEMKQAVKNAIKNKWGDKPPKDLRSPFNYPDEDKIKQRPEYGGKIYVNAKNKNQQPGILAPDKSIIGESRRTEIYSGMVARAHLNAYAYDAAGNRGVAFGLNHIMKIRDGEPLGGRPQVEDAFAEVEVPKPANDNSDIYDL